MKIEPLHLRLETLLDRELSLGHQHVEVSGCNSPAPLSLMLAYSRSKYINNLPRLVVTSSSESAEALKRELLLFEPSQRIHILPSFDVSPYSTLMPNAKVSAQRISWLWRAQNANNTDIFIAPVSALQQKSLPFAALSSAAFVLEIGDEVPANLTNRLHEIGYVLSPSVDEIGQCAVRGGIIDIYSPAHRDPIRLELFGDQIESIRFFSPEDNRSIGNTSKVEILPAREAFFSGADIEQIVKKFRQSIVERPIIKEEFDEVLRSILRKTYSSSTDFLLPFFHEALVQPLEHFSTDLNVFILDSIEVFRQADNTLLENRSDFENAEDLTIRPTPDSWFVGIEALLPFFAHRRVDFSLLSIDQPEGKIKSLSYRASSPLELSNLLQQHPVGSDAWCEQAGTILKRWRHQGSKIFIFSRNHSQGERLKILFEKVGIESVLGKDDELLFSQWMDQQSRDERLVHIIPTYFESSIKLSDEDIIILRDEDFFGQKARLKSGSAQKEFHKQAERLSFGELNPGDYVVHIKHGVGQYEGLKIMPIGGIDQEFIQISYKEKDKLYLPVYRVGQLQKYSTGAHSVTVDKLGGPGWEKTKTKVKAHLKDIASELLALYAKRAEMMRPSFSPPDADYRSFENSFPYDETDDQLRAIGDILKDLTGSRPMDRLICGDVGFGKTEVAMRAAFKAVEDGKQVAILAPTTVLTFQHAETFKKRFKGWPIEIRALNRFVANPDVKKTLTELKEGKADILIGTHRLLSKDVQFKDLGLLIVDEEQKFGVTHKERIKKLKNNVDTLTLSATPIPRTLNMSLAGVRDLSLITTPPVDRLPTRTYVCKFEGETIRKAILAEIERGGQVYFIHNRVQGIYSVADELKTLIPEARMKVAHGQMDEEQLEDTMVAFFNHEIDVLICTTIVESGMDVQKANTIIIDNAHQLGLSQLYQLRGRVGRSNHRAYCYLLLPRGKAIEPHAQERLKVIQENTALGSGLIVAQHDLELRGAGNILGEEQSGHVNLVGYELYMELLNEAVAEAKGEPIDDKELDPEINLRIPAMIPDSYIGDIRLRLSYYKALSAVESQDDLNSIEDELKDRFGNIPEQVLNLMGIMLIRAQCKKLGIREVSAGVKTISLVATERTPLRPEVIIQLAMRENKKYSITPDNRLNIRMNIISIPRVYEELEYLIKNII